MATSKPAARKVTTPKFRASFVYIFKPQDPMEGSANKDPKYGVTMLFDQAGQKTPEFKALRQLAITALKEKFGDKLKPDGNGWFVGMKNPLRDGAEKAEMEGYGEGIIFASATSKMQPGLVDQSLQRIISEQDFFSGCYARATVTAYGFDKAGNRGVAFGLQNVQKLANGDAFSGRTAAEDEFDKVDDADFAEEGEAAFLG